MAAVIPPLAVVIARLLGAVPVFFLLGVVCRREQRHHQLHERFGPVAELQMRLLDFAPQQTKQLRTHFQHHLWACNMASHHTPRSNAIRKQDVKKGKMPKKKKNIYEKAFNTGSLKIYRYLDLGTRRVNE